MEKGKYVWEAWLGNTKVGSKYFYLEDIATRDNILPKDYMGIKSVHFFEGSYDHNDNDQKQLTIFNAEETRYIYADITCKNILVDQEWIGEFILRYSNEARELKGEIRKIINVKKGEDELKLSGGWGSNVKDRGEKEYISSILYLWKVSSYRLLLM